MSMKKLYLINFIIIICFSFKAEGSDYRKYNDKSGRILYSYSGNTTGECLIIWDDWGQKEYKEDKYYHKAFGLETNVHMFSITLDQNIFSWNFSDSQFIKSKNRDYFDFKKLYNHEKSFEENFFFSLRNIGLKKVKRDFVNDKECELWESDALGKNWIWNTYSIKSIVTISVLKVEVNAVQIELNIPIDSNIFTLPRLPANHALK